MENREASEQGHDRRRLFVLVVIVAIFVRVSLIPVTGFGDLWFNNDVAELLVTHGPDIYRDVEETLGSRYSQPAEFVIPYGPAYYYPIGVYHLALTWVGVEDYEHCDADCQLENNPLRWALITKLPYLLADIMIVFLLFWGLPRTIGRIAAVLWLAAPGMIFISYLQGQIDVLSLLPLLAAIILLYRELGDEQPSSHPRFKLRRDDLAMVAIGIGAAVKMIPVMFLPAMLIVAARDTRHALRLLFITAATFALLTVAFWDNQLFQSVFLFGGGRTGVFLNVRILNLSPFLLAYGAGLAMTALHKDRRNRRHLLQMMVLVSGLLVVFGEFNPQRSAYLIALLALTTALEPRAIAGYVIANIYPFIFGLVGTGLGVGLFLHIAPEVQLIPPWLRAFENDYRLEDIAVAAVTLMAIAMAIGIIALWRGRETQPAHQASSKHYLLAIALAIVPLLYVAVTVSAGFLGIGDRDINITTGSSTGELPGATVRETFTAQNDRLSGIDLLIDPLDRSNTHSILVKVLLPGRTTPLGISERSATEITRGKPKVLHFGFSPIEQSKNKRFLIEVTFPGSVPGNAVGLVTTPSGPQIEINGQTDNAQLQFRDLYQFPWRSAASAFGTSLKREWLAYVTTGVFGILSILVILGGTVYFPAVSSYVRRIAPKVPASPAGAEPPARHRGWRFWRRR